MLITEILNEMKSFDIRTVNKDALVDVSDFHFDNNLSAHDRVIRIFKTMHNPYCFRIGDMVVKLEFAENGQILQDVMTSFLLRQKSGL